MDVQRKALLTAELGGTNFTRAEIKEVTLQPGQKTGYHLHPVPVISYVTQGSVIFQIEGQAEVRVPADKVIFEPANTNILKYDNASETEPLVFIATYLLDGDQELIKPLGQH